MLLDDAGKSVQSLSALLGSRNENQMVCKATKADRAIRLYAQPRSVFSAISTIFKCGSGHSWRSNGAINTTRDDP